MYFYVTFKKKSYYDISRKKKSRNISWKHRSMKKKILLQKWSRSIVYIFVFWLPICDQHLNQSTFLLILFCFIILHVWKIWKYIITSITIIQQRKNLFSSSRNLAGPYVFFPCVKMVKMELCQPDPCFRNISQLQQFQTKNYLFELNYMKLSNCNF